MNNRLISPTTVPVLDPVFRPSALVWRHLKQTADSLRVTVAVEQADGSIFHSTCQLPSGNDPGSIAWSQYLLMHHVRCALWAYGGFRVHIHGAPAAVTDWLKYHYYIYDARGEFDADVMGPRLFDQDFEIVVHPSLNGFPAPKQTDIAVNLGAKRCFIGFDLGAGNRRVVAVIDGKVIWQEDQVWAPKGQPDPEYHYREIGASLQAAQGNLPRVDGIGGSAAGIYFDNCPRMATLFMGVPRDAFKQSIVPLFHRLRADFSNVPFRVVNDGEVAALAAAIEMKASRVLGLAFGSSTAGGWVTANGHLTTQLDELAFFPIDMNPSAPVDDWSQFRGCASKYLSEQMITRLAAAAGINLDPSLNLAQQLKFVQQLLLETNDTTPKAERVFQTVGDYLAHALAAYDPFYGVEMAYLMGRVMEGRGGDIVLEHARTALSREYPDLADRCRLVRPTGESVSMGQAVAAAYLAAGAS